MKLAHTQTVHPRDRSPSLSAQTILGQQKTKDGVRIPELCITLQPQRLKDDVEAWRTGRATNLGVTYQILYMHWLFARPVVLTTNGHLRQPEQRMGDNLRKSSVVSETPRR
jgi:hypothetical protein